MMRGWKMKKKVDMSEEAILRRLKTVDQLRQLCLSLMKAKKKSDEMKIKESCGQIKTSPKNCG